MSNNPNEFPTTNWTLIRDADSEPVSGPRLSLNQLLTRYVPALESHVIRQRRVSEDEAEEIVQAFITDKVIERKLLAQADRSRGRFRDLLARSIDNFANDQHRRQASSLRSPGRPMLRLDLAVVAEIESGSADPKVGFDRAWAETVMAEATRRAIQRCEQTNRSKVWQVFQSRTIEQANYAQLCEQLGFRTQVEAANAVVTAKRIMSRMVRQVLSEHAGGGAGVDVDEELRDLKKILAGGAAP